MFKTFFKVEEVVKPLEPELEDPVPEKTPDEPSKISPEQKPASSEPRPRFCKLTKGGEGGYGFNLHSDKGSKTKSVVSNVVEGIFNSFCVYLIL